MKIDVFTLFPAWFDWFSGQRHVRNALELGHGLGFTDLRATTPMRAGQVDDTPYGGGAGMVIRVDVVEVDYGPQRIQQRQQTLYRVTQSIFKFQQEFLDHGVSRLRPMVLRDVAEDIDMHESTVSRATANKYVHTPQGLFELKFFFSSGVASSDEGGEGAAAGAVKAAIGELIGKETEILSDDTLVDLLKERGFDLARRTVAKYREAMGIGSSIQRRRERKISGR